MMKALAELNIHIPTGINGHTRTTCPQCSPNRKKSTEKCLSVDISEGLYYCHHCGFAGGIKGSDEAEEAKIYFRRPDVDPNTKKLPNKVLKWFESRGISQKILAANHIGYGKSMANKGAIQFPYIKEGNTVNIKHRTRDKQFRQEKNAEKCLYRFDEIAKVEGDTLIITEGEIDALSFCEARFDMVTSIPDGAPSEDAKSFRSKFDFLKSAEAIIARYKRIILAVDNDGPGQLVEEELARRIGAEKCYRVRYPEGCKDANDVLVRHRWGALRTLVQEAKPFPVEGLFSACDFEREVRLLYKKGARPGLSTGWKSVDQCYTIKPAEFTVVTGIPGHGKSTFLDALIVNMIREHEWRFVFFSPENWPVQRHLQSLIEKFEMKPFLRHGRYSERIGLAEVMHDVTLLSDYCFFIYPEKSQIMTLDTILEKARAAIFRHGVNAVIIDPWNEIDHDYQNMTEAQYLSKSLSRIRQFARLNGVHIWVVAHPRNLTKEKDGSYKPPTMYEISGGAHWRNKSDNGLCIFRPDFNRDEIKVYVQKIRFREVGKVGEIDLRFISDYGGYDEM